MGLVNQKKVIKKELVKGENPAANEVKSPAAGKTSSKKGKESK